MPDQSIVHLAALVFFSNRATPDTGQHLSR